MSDSPRVDGAPSSASVIDVHLLAGLERAFAAHAGSNGVIDEARLHRALGLRSSYLGQTHSSSFRS
jgi:hypothetical protein